MRGNNIQKKELVSKVTDLLRDSGVRRTERSKKFTFHISDDSGNKSDFKVKQPEGKYQYTNEDVAVILDALTEVVIDNIRNGRGTMLQGFGSLLLHCREARKVRGFDGNWAEIKAKLVPKFYAGKELKAAAKIYELSLDNTEPFSARNEAEDDAEDDE